MTTTDDASNLFDRLQDWVVAEAGKLRLSNDPGDHEARMAYGRDLVERRNQLVLDPAALKVVVDILDEQKRILRDISELDVRSARLDTLQQVMSRLSEIRVAQIDQAIESAEFEHLSLEAELLLSQFDPLPDD